MTNTIVKRTHYGFDVWVNKELAETDEQLKAICLCYSCDKFNPEDRENNCQRANTIYSLCVLLNMAITPLRCPNWKRID